jgi:hypothetical protein
MNGAFAYADPTGELQDRPAEKLTSGFDLLRGERKGG